MPTAITNFNVGVPENFVARSRNQAGPTSLYDCNGAWMKAGRGGDVNTLNITVASFSQNGTQVVTKKPVPVRFRLWTVTRAYRLEKLVCEVNNSCTTTRGNFKTSTELKVKSNEFDELVLNNDGEGSFSFRIMTTSKQYHGRKFSVEVLRDGCDTDACEGGVIYKENGSLTFPIEVMSKINKYKEKQKNSLIFPDMLLPMSLGLNEKPDIGINLKDIFKSEKTEPNKRCRDWDEFSVLKRLKSYDLFPELDDLVFTYD